MEFAAPADDSVANALLCAVLDAAREGGARRLTFHATPSWRHWGLLEAVSGRAPSPGRMLFVERRIDSEVNRLERWQLLPGDFDAL